MDIEKKYKREFDILVQKGNLVKDWTNVYQHCKTEGFVAAIMSNLLKLSKEESDILIKAAILHDWYKRNERERADKKGFEEYVKSEKDSYNELIKLEVDKRVVDVAHSVGSLSLNKIIDSTDFLKRLMHYIDDICLGDKIVEVDERIDYLENQEKYHELNESGRKVFSGKTYFKVQREVAKQIQTEIESKLNIEPNSLVRLIKEGYQKIK